MAEARRGFTVPPEVPRYFADKNLSPRFSWLDVFGEEHAYSHTVAKATELELLAAFQKSIQTALEKGQGFENWRDNLRPELERLGWWKPRRVTDPEGRLPDALVDFSSPRRLKTIFWSNMRSARAAGQWERIQRTKKALPYLLYVRTTSAEPRPEHLTWAGLILPVDDPFWNSHMPPNGWMCKCAVRQITAREAEKKIATGNYLTEAPPVVTKPFLNRRTGEIAHIPVGIDPGWHRNPGLAASRRRALTGSLQEKIEATLSAPDGGKLIRPAVSEVVKEIASGPEFQKLYDEALRTHQIREAARKAAKAAGLDDSAIKAAEDAAAHWQHRPLPVATIPARLDHLRGNRPITVSASDNAIGHSHSSHPTPAVEWQRIQEALDRGEVQSSSTEDKLWFFVKEADRSWVTVIAPRGDAWRVVTHFRSSERYRIKQRQKPGRIVLMNEKAGKAD